MLLFVTLFGLAGCNNSSGAAELCRKYAVREAQQESTVAVACLNDEVDDIGSCELSADHGSLAIWNRASLDDAKAACEELDGTWVQSEEGFCPVQEVLDGSKFEVEVGCVFP